MTEMLAEPVDVPLLLDRFPSIGKVIPHAMEAMLGSWTGCDELQQRQAGGHAGEVCGGAR